MAKKSHADIAARRRAVIDFLAEEDHSVEELMAKLLGRIAKRTIHEDIAFLRASFPTHLQHVRAGGNHGTSRVAYRWTGAIPHLLSQPLGWLGDDELMALIAARGLLHHNDRTLASGLPAGDGLVAARHGAGHPRKVAGLHGAFSVRQLRAVCQPRAGCRGAA